MRRRTAAPDHDDEDGFGDRWVRLEETFRGAGSLSGELTPQCRAALRAVPDCLGKRQGPEGTRSKAQREHDAIHEACRRLLSSACLPDRAGQPAAAGNLWVTSLVPGQPVDNSANSPSGEFIS